MPGVFSTRTDGRVAKKRGGKRPNAGRKKSDDFADQDGALRAQRAVVRVEQLAPPSPRSRSRIRHAFDHYSSAWAFEGWSKRGRDRDDFGLPVSQPRTEMLTFDWELYGLIDPFEVPGPLPPCRLE
jgi:hypothetical protein